MKKTLAILLVLCLILGTLCACGSSGGTTPADGGSGQSGKADGGSSSGQQASGKTQLNIAADWAGVPNPYDLNASFTCMRIGVTEGLVRFADDSTYQPWLADSWSVADDDLTWTFVLHPGIKFSNGADLTATKVKESLEALYEAQDPDNGGAGDVLTFMEYTSITADDAAGTVTIVTKEPVPDMPGVLAYPLFAISDAKANAERDLLVEGPVGTGPYMVKSYTTDHDYQLVKNPDYWDGEVPFETVSYVCVSEPGSRYQALLDGSADVATHIQASDLSALESAGYTVSNVSGSRTGYYHVNFEGPMGNDALRRAVFMAIDDETVCNITTGGSYTPGYTPLSPIYTQWGGDQIADNTAYNPEQAMKILDDAGIVDTDGDGWRELDGENIKLTYITNTSRQMGEISQAHASLIQAIGIDCEAQIVDSQGDYMRSGNFDMVNSNEIIIATGDPTNFLSHWYTGSGTGYNYSRYSNPEFDATYEQLKTEMDTAKRNELLKKLQEILVEDNVVLLGGYYNYNICSSAEVTGAYNPPCDFYWLTKDIKPAA